MRTVCDFFASAVGSLSAAASFQWFAMDSFSASPRQEHLLGNEQGRPDPRWRKVGVDGPLDLVRGDVPEFVQVLVLGLQAAQEELEEAELGGQPAKGLLGLEQRIFEVDPRTLVLVGGEAVRSKEGQLLDELGPEQLDLVRVELRMDHEHAPALEHDRRDRDLVHQLAFVLEGTVKSRGLVSAQEIAQDLEGRGIFREEPGNGESHAQIGLLPWSGQHRHLGLVHPCRGDGRRLQRETLPGVGQLAEKPLDLGQDLLLADVAADHQDHLLGLILARDILLDVLRGDRGQRLPESEDGPCIGCPGPDLRLQGVEELALRTVLAALDLGVDDLLLALQLSQIDCGAEDHVLEHVEPQGPMFGRHIDLVHGLIESGGRVEIAARAFDVPGDLTRGPLGRSLEDHVLEQVADARLGRVLVCRAGMDVKPEGDQRKPLILLDEHLHAVGQEGNGCGGDALACSEQCCCHTDTPHQ
jgi:hypothetical protein